MGEIEKSRESRNQKIEVSNRVHEKGEKGITIM